MEKSSGIWFSQGDLLGRMAHKNVEELKEACGVQLFLNFFLLNKI